MDPITLLKQALVFAHLLAFAIALGEVLRADLRLLRDRVVDSGALHRTARIAAFGLAALWATGLGLVYLDTGFDPAVLAENPKLMAKLIVVGALTANGAMLHAFALPIMTGSTARGWRMRLAAMLGAISTVSWVYAAFVGVGRLIAPQMTLTIYLGLYVTALVAGIATGIAFVAPLIERRLKWVAIRESLFATPQMGLQEAPLQKMTIEGKKAA